MPTCDVLGCTNFSVTTVSAPGVEGGQLHISESHLSTSNQVQRIRWTCKPENSAAR